MVYMFLLLLWSAYPGPVRADAGAAPVASAQEGLTLIQAIYDTIELQPDVLLQHEEVAESRGNFQMEAGQFDPALTSSLNYQTAEYAPTYYEHILYGIGNRAYTSTDSSVSLEKKTRYGISFGPSVGINRTHGISDYMIPTSSNQTIVAFSLNVPILKGWGKDATGADEMAAAVELEASRLDLQHTIASSVKETVVAYWAYLEARMQLEILKQMEADSRSSLKNMKELVKGHDQPASNLDTFVADLADKTSQRISGEQDLFKARQNLGLAMGLRYETIDNLPMPADAYPNPDKKEALFTKLEPEQLFQEALRRRADYLALKKRETEARILLVAAANNLLPQLDVNGTIGYAGLKDGGNIDDYFKSLTNELTGANYSAGITLTFPFGNNEAEGEHLKQRSQLRKAVIQTRNLDRKIRSGIVVDYQAIIRSIRELGEIRKSVKHYRTAVSNEKIKFGMGMASVLDIINTQNFLRNSMLSEVAKMNSYATALVNLRYQTGTLLSVRGEGYTVMMDYLTHPPGEK